MGTGFRRRPQALPGRTKFDAGWPTDLAFADRIRTGTETPLRANARTPGRGRNQTGSPQVIVGVPKEVKDHETRVGLVPSGVIALREAGHKVFVESNAGKGSSIPDQDYVDAGAEILANAGDV